MGGMAEIFKAKTFGHGGFENVVVIKRILAHLSENPSFVKMFMDEAKITALLQHGNIVRIYDFGKIDRNYFIAMECVEGKDVKQVLRKLAERRKLIPREFAVYIAMEAAKGLDYAHKRTTLQGAPLDIVHRDVSPSNILVSYNGEVKVADFGIVKAANCAETTNEGMLKGKFEYMSPEQAGGKDIDRRSDIFSVGIILWEMLTGRRLFKTDSELKTLEKIKSGDFEAPSKMNHTVPPRLDEIVMRALAVDPDDRYADARDLHADLLDFLYPAPPDVTQQSLALYMKDLFTEEVSGERDRMEEGTRLAQAMHETAASVDLEPDWEEGGSARSQPGKAVAETQQQPTASRMPLVAAIVLLSVVIMIGIGAVAWIYLDQPVQTKPSEMQVQVAAPTTSTIRVKVSPVAGKVYLDGRLYGEQKEVVIEEVTPGAEHTLRVEAEGYQAYEEKMTLDAGSTLPVPVVLTANPVVPPPPSDRREETSTASTAVLRISSSPAGAEVVINGRVVGKTPLDWTGKASERVGLELRAGGYQTVKTLVNLPRSGRDSQNYTLQKQGDASPPPQNVPAVGKLTVTVRGGWGTVYVDGVKKGDAPKTWELPAGNHTIKVVNVDVGLDYTQEVKIEAGKTATISVSGQ